VSYDVGDLWTPELTVRDEDGALTDATVEVATISPSGVAGTPSVTHVSTGVYTAQVLLDEVGQWVATWDVSGAVTGVESQSAYVRRLASNVISVSEVRSKALNKSLTVDDDEIERMLDAAIAEYEQYVGPVSGEVTETLSGGSTSLLLRSPNVSAITAAVYSDGTTITVDDLDLDTATGIVGWGYNTAGYFTRGIRNVTLTYTVGALPANHREAIIADVAGYFDLTQSGPAGPDDGYALAQRGAPLVLFPRIRALAAPSIA
jgi:hypothetical protein